MFMMMMMMMILYPELWNNLSICNCEVISTFVLPLC